jgi:hypothetical protein
MSRANLFKITNIALFISVSIQIVSGAAMLLGNFAVRLGLFDLMVKMHKYNGFIFLGLICLHIYQNWGWVKANILKQNKTV